MSLGKLKDALQSPQVHVVWTAIRRFIESIQMFSLLAIPQFKWPVDVLDGVDDIAIISWLAIDVTDGTYTAVLIVICSVITLYIVVAAMSVFSAFCGCECMECVCSLCACDDCGGDDCAEYLWFDIPFHFMSTNKMLSLQKQRLFLNEQVLYR